MFLLLLIAVLMGCQQFSGHCPIGNAVLCPLWRQAPGTKKLRVGPFIHCSFRGGGPGWVIACDQTWWWCFMAWQKFEIATMESLGGRSKIWSVLKENDYQLFHWYTALSLYTWLKQWQNNQTKKLEKHKTCHPRTSRFFLLIHSFKYFLLLN